MFVDLTRQNHNSKIQFELKHSELQPWTLNPEPRTYLSAWNWQSFFQLYIIMVWFMESESKSCWKGIIPLNIKYISYTLLMVFCLSIGSLGVTSAVEVINWRSYEEGLAVSKVEKKKVFLHHGLHTIGRPKRKITVFWLYGSMAKMDIFFFFRNFHWWEWLETLGSCYLKDKAYIYTAYG